MEKEVIEVDASITWIGHAVKSYLDDREILNYKQKYPEQYKKLLSKYKNEYDTDYALKSNLYSNQEFCSRINQEIEQLTNNYFEDYIRLLDSKNENAASKEIILNEIRNQLETK